MSAAPAAPIHAAVSIPALAQRPRHGPLFRLSARAWQVVAVVGLGVFALHAGLGVGGPAADRFVEIWVYYGLEALAVGAIAGPGDPRAGRACRLGVARRGARRLHVSATSSGRSATAATPRCRRSPIAFYLVLLPGVVRGAPAARPLEGVALQPQRLARRRQRRPGGRRGRGGASCSRSRSTTPRASRLAVATNLAYPLGDVVLLALVVGVFWLVGRNAGLEWVVIGGGVPRHRGGGCRLPLDVRRRHLPGGDAARHPLAADGDPARCRRLGSPGPLPPDRRCEGRPLVATPIICTLMALAVFVDDHCPHLNVLALVLAAATIGARADPHAR